MSNILLIQSSPNPKSVSSMVAEKLVDHLKTSESKVTIRKLDNNKVKHFDTEMLSHFWTPKDKLNDKQKDILQLSTNMIQELKDNDIIVIATPLHNFMVSSSLKSWVDHVVKAGETFKYVNGKPTGLLSNKTVYLVVASGGVYPDLASGDFATAYIKHVMNFIGLTDVRVVKAEGLAFTQMDKVMEKVLATIKEVTKEPTTGC
jgi:FMN-dependent NADH-azoreductase